MSHLARIALAALPLWGCVDGFKGSNLQFDFASGTPVEASPGATVKPAQLPNNISLRLYAVDEETSSNALFEVQHFEIHRIVDLSSPCFIDVGPHVPHQGLHVSQFSTRIAMDDNFTITGGVVDTANPPPGATEAQKIEVATAVQRQNNIRLLSADGGITAITSASSVTYPPVDADCNGTGLPPPTCADDASNARRLEKCQAVWATDPNFYEGTDRVLVSPLNGTTFGMVDGMNPINLSPVGGAQFFVDTNLDRFTAYAIYWQFDDADGDGKPDYPASVPADQRTDTGTLLYYGHTSTPTRGVIHASLQGVANPKLSVELAIFANLGDDSVSF